VPRKRLLHAVATPEQLVAGLVRLLTVTPAGDHAYTGGQQPGGIGRVFGGQVIA